MPPRFAYWTILAGGLPTSFRAADRDELMPTFRRLKEKHPDAVMKYFARGKLWDSAEDARRDRLGDEARTGRQRSGGAPRERDPRGRDWRPGGDHRDPRQKFKDAKKARNEEHRRQKWERKNERTPRPAPQVRPHGDPLAPQPERRTGAKGSRHGSRRSGIERGPNTASGSGPQRRDRKPGGGQHRRVPDLRGQDREARFANSGRKPPVRQPQGGPPHDRGPRRDFRSSSQRSFIRNQEAPPPNVPRPDREPPPGREPKPDPPPRPSEPTIKPPPPERGRGAPDARRPRRPREE